MTTELSYHYLYESHRLPANSRCIRVLEVHAPIYGGSDTGPISCDISVVDLDTKPSFAALSYARGSLAISELSCGNVLLPVTLNCYSAIWHLRKRLGAFRIWVDEVCIDETNVEEKEQQISLIGEVFANADEVYVWLGKGSDATERAMSYLGEGGLYKYYAGDSSTDKEQSENAQLKTALRDYYRAAWNTRGTMVQESLDIHKHLIGSPLFSRPPWRYSHEGAIVTTEDLAELLDNDWLDGIWTYPEICFASRPIIVSGLSHLSWSRFTHAMIFVHGLTTFSSLRKWTDTIRSRALFRERVKDDRAPSQINETDALNGYVDFIHKFRDVEGNATTDYCYLAMSVVVLTVIALTLLIHHFYSESDWSARAIIHFSVFTIEFALLPFIGKRLFRRSSILYSRPRQPIWSMHSRYMHSDILNAVCSREAKEPKDLSFAVISMLHHLYLDPLLKVDYSADTAHVYTILAAFFLQKCKDPEVLALAAEASYPGASSWVPDFSKNRNSMAGPEDVRLTGRRKPGLGWNQEKEEIHRRHICIEAQLCCIITAVADFVDTTRMSFDMRQSGLIHNAERMLFMPAGNMQTRRLYGTRHFDTKTPVWLQVFKESFGKEVKSIKRGRLSSHNSIVLDCMRNKSSPQELVKRLDAKGLLDVFESMCKAFADCERLYFIMETSPRCSRHPLMEPAFDRYQGQSRWMAYVVAQQGQIQDGDEMVGVENMEGHVVVRRSQEALIARLDGAQSQRLMSEVADDSVIMKEKVVLKLS